MGASVTQALIQQTRLHRAGFIYPFGAFSTSMLDWIMVGPFRPERGGWEAPKQARKAAALPTVSQGSKPLLQGRLPLCMKVPPCTFCPLFLGQGLLLLLRGLPLSGGGGGCVAASTLAHCLPASLSPVRRGAPTCAVPTEPDPVAN